MKIKYGIPSYQRVNAQPALELLVSSGVPREDIVVSTQTDKDFEEYSKRYSDSCVVIKSDGNTLSENKNNILKYFQNEKRILLIDDDIGSFFVLKETRLKKICSSDLVGVFMELFEYAEKQKASAWGFSFFKNALYMSPTIDTYGLLDCCFGLLRTDYLFDPSFKLQVNIELSCRILADGHKILKYNYLAYDGKYRQSGGCTELRQGKNWEESTLNLLKKYPQLVKLNEKSGSIKYIGRKN